MAATGSHSPGDLAQSVVQIVKGCQAEEAKDDQQQGTAKAAKRDNVGQCVSSQVNHNQNGDENQDEKGGNGSKATPGTHQDHGQGSGSGSAGAPGQGGSGNGQSHRNGNGSGQGGHHEPSPHA